MFNFRTMQDEDVNINYITDFTDYFANDQLGIILKGLYKCYIAQGLTPVEAYMKTLSSLSCSK